MNIGHIIRKYRKAKSMTQAELGKKLGVSHATVGRYESNDIIPPIDKIDQMAELFGSDFLLESMGMELKFPYEATFEHQLINALSEIYTQIDTDDGNLFDLIVTADLDQYVVAYEDIKEFCDRCKEYLEIAFKHFLADHGTLQPRKYSFDEEEQENNGKEE